MAKKKIKISEQDSKVQYVLEKYSSSKDYYRDLRKKFTSWDDMFFNTPEQKRYSWMSNLVVPATHKAIMTLLSRVVNNTFAVDPNFDVVPSNKHISNLIRSQIYRGGFFTQYVLFCLQLLIRGTSIAKVSWQKQTKSRFSLEPVIKNIINQLTGEGEFKIQGYKKKPKITVKYDGPVFETIDLFDFFPEPKATTLMDGARVFRSIKTKNEFMKNPNYINKDAVLSTMFPQPEVFPHSRLKNIGLQEPTYISSQYLPTEKAKDLADYVELLECETRWWNPETNKLEPWILTIANQKVLIRDESFPYWNCESLYLKGAWIPILNEFYGIGIPELTESLQQELNDKRNQRIDNINQILMPVFMYEEGGIDPRVMRTFERKPGAKLRMRPGGIMSTKWDYAPDVTATAMVECQNLENDIEEITGAVKSIQPSSSPGHDIHRTSSGLMLLQSMAYEKIKLNLSILERSVIEPMFEKYFDLNLQFLTQGYRIFDPDGKEAIYSPEKITGDYEFRAKGSRYALDQQMKIMNLSRTIEALSKSGLPLGELHINLWMRLYEAMGFEDKDEIEKILRNEIAKAQQQAAALAQAKAGGTTGSPGTPQNLMRDLTGAGMGADAMRSGAGSMIPGGG